MVFDTPSYYSWEMNTKLGIFNDEQEQSELHLSMRLVEFKFKLDCSCYLVLGQDA